MHNPERTVSLVQDVAKCLEKIAVGPQHTPALYATFLRALVDAKPKPSDSSSSPPGLYSATSTHAESQSWTSPPIAWLSSDSFSTFQNAIPETLYFDPSVFDSSGAMGAPDLSNVLLDGFAAPNTPKQAGKELPNFQMPTDRMATDGEFSSLMMPAPQASTGSNVFPGESSDMNMFSMDSILSPGFWDNILIPGNSRLRW